LTLYRYDCNVRAAFPLDNPGDTPTPPRETHPMAKKKGGKKKGKGGGILIETVPQSK